ncbi:hypothetical protein ACO0SA_001216 [Hanseniaspora valbyensis]
MSITKSYENHLWKFLNLEENDDQGLNELASELSNDNIIKGEDEAKYFKLKLKIALASKDLTNYNILKFQPSDITLKSEDDFETVLLKSQLFTKFSLPLDSFNKDLKNYIDDAIDNNSDIDDKKDELLHYYNDNFVLKPSHDIKKKKDSLEVLDNEPIQENKTDISIINKFKDLLYNNEIYNTINNEYKPTVKDIFQKVKLVVLSSYNNKDKNYYYMLLLILLFTSVVTVKGYKYIKKAHIKLYNKIKLLLRLCN